jgi:hypothetical protein
MISQTNQSAACQNLATQLMRLRWLDFGNLMPQTPTPRPVRRSKVIPRLVRLALAQLCIPRDTEFSLFMQISEQESTQPKARPCTAHL